MSYHVVVPRFGFKELPDRVLVREDGAYGDHKAHGTPMINYWYVLEQRIPPTEHEIISAHLEQLKLENAKLCKYVAWLEKWALDHAGFGMGAEAQFELDMARRELGVEVD